MTPFRRAVLLALLPALSACQAAKHYAWQDRCDEACYGDVGERQMAYIDAKGCIELQGMREGKAGSLDPVDRRWIDAIDDKMRALGCSERGGLAAYAPTYPWQKRCLEECEGDLGADQMRDINRYGCKVVGPLLPDARNPRRAKDYAQNVRWYEAWSKAMLDRNDALGCE